MHAALLQAVAIDPVLCGQVAVTATGCLGPCFDGAMLVVYPEGIWYAGVTESDVAEIVARHLVAGEPVRRLIHDWPED